MNKTSCIFTITKIKIEEGENKHTIKGMLNFINVDTNNIKKEEMMFKFITNSEKKIIELKDENNLFVGYGNILKANGNFYINFSEIFSINKIESVLRDNLDNKQEEKTEEESNDIEEAYAEEFEGTNFKAPSIANGVKLCTKMF